MKNTATVTLRKVTIQSNTNQLNKADWLQIRDANSGQILHTGRPEYIRRVARKRYNLQIRS